MPPKQTPKSGRGKRQTLQLDKAGDLFADVPENAAGASLRVSFRRSWYSPPLTDAGEVDYEAVATDLAQELRDGTLVVRNYLENGELGFGAEIRVGSKEELESTLRTLRKVFNDGLKQDNAIRQAALARCQAKLAELEQRATAAVELRKEQDRRRRERRGRQLLGMAWFRRDDRRKKGERRRSTRRQSA